MTGRPSSFTPEMGAEICARLMEGDSLRKICKEPGFPGLRTVFQWLEAHPSFAQQYTHAREVQGHVLFEMARDEAFQAEDASLGRLRYDACRWHASKLVPKVYGEKLSLDATVRRDPAELSDDELAALAAGGQKSD